MNGLTHTTLFHKALIALLAIATCAQPAAAADYVVDFEDGTKTAYASGSVTLNGISWNFTEALIGSLANDWKNGEKCARLRGYTASAISMEADKSDGIGEVSFFHRRFGTDAQVPWRVEVSVNGGVSWTPVGMDFTPSDTVGTFNATVSQPGPARIRVVAVNAGSSDRRANIDDLLLTDFGAAASNRPPYMVTLTGKNVPEGGDLQFLVTATDPDNADAVTLRAQNLPPGAIFAETTATPAVSNVFSWIAASPTGVYDVTFLAIDKDGTNVQSVTIEVLAALNTNQSRIVHFNEVRYNDAGSGANTPDNKEFVELIAHAGVNLEGCTLVHYNGSASQDGGIWTFTFPAFVVPDDGLTDTNGVACGFVLLAQPAGLLAGDADFLLPTDPASTTNPPASLQNGPDGLVLYDPQGAVLDAIAWGISRAPNDTGDLLVDDPGPGVISRDIPPTAAAYLHVPPYSSNDNSPQAPNDVIGDTGQNWVALNATPGALNFNQQDGRLILTIQTPPPPPVFTGLMLIVR